jgi:hypothetical protein
MPPEGPRELSFHVALVGKEERISSGRPSSRDEVNVDLERD